MEQYPVLCQNAESRDKMLKGVTKCLTEWQNAEGSDKMLKGLTECWKDWQNAENCVKMLVHMYN